MVGINIISINNIKMKKIIYAMTLLTLLGWSNSTNAQTSIADGNWSNPATWGGAPPLGSGTVIINHSVTLDMDYSHSSGSITIGASGFLYGDSPMRLFSLNYPSGTATLTIDGFFYVARVPLFFGSVTNSGILQADSLLNAAAITNNSMATISTTQLMNSTSGTINNSGAINSTDFFNIETVINAGIMTSNDFTNSKSFTNENIGVIIIARDFSNIDTLASPAIFTNNGNVIVQNDWHNGNQINGSGRFCVYNNTWNSGAMTGTLDFCDQTGGNIDLNTGTIAGTITYCLFPCNVGIDELSKDIVINVYPNPFSTEITLTSDEVFKNATLTVYNSQGQTVKQIEKIMGQTVTMFRDNLSSGLYFFRIEEDNKVSKTGKFVIAD